MTTVPTDCQIAHQAWPSVFTSNVDNACCTYSTGFNCAGACDIYCDDSETYITGIKAQRSRFSGSFPDLGGLKRLTSLEISYTGMTGPLPSVLPQSLTSLILSGNSFNGSIPPLPYYLKVFLVQGSKLTGSLPSLPFSLTMLDVSQNQLTGEIPSLPQNLQTLALQNNNFTGSVPPLPTTLQTLNLENNSLTGAIPSIPSGVNTPVGLNGNCFIDSDRFNVTNNPSCEALLKPSTNTTTDSGATGRLIGSIVGGVAGLVLICCVLFWYIRKKRTGKESSTRLDGSDIPGPQTGQPKTRPISTLVDIPVSRQGSSSSSSSTEDTIIPEQEIVLNPQPREKRSMINDAFMVSNGEGEKGSFMNAAFMNVSLPGFDKKDKENVTAGESGALRWVSTNPDTALWSVEDTRDWAAMIPRVGVTLKAVIIKEKLRFTDLIELSGDGSLQQVLNLPLGDYLNVKRALTEMREQGELPPSYEN